MKIWIAKNSEVPVSEQLAAQITLGIASGDLRLGEKLPSTREIARRCGVHANTVGAVYRGLVQQQLLEFRKGSGFYVTESAGTRIEGSRRLDELVERFLSDARDLGFSRDEIVKRLRKTRYSTPSDEVTLVEGNEGLRAILLHELSSESIPVVAAGYEDLSSGRFSRLTLLAAMLDEKPKLESILRDGQKCVYLRGRSVSAAMSGETRPSLSDLVAVVSGWDGFLTFARIMLLAAKIDPGNLIVRSTADEGWRDAIKNASIVICDSLTAATLDGATGVRAFRIVSDESLGELRAALNAQPSS